MSFTMVRACHGCKEYVKIDPRFFRPTEARVLIADCTKARQKLGWKPKVTFKELIRIMVDADIEAIGLTSSGEGKSILAGHGFNTSDRAYLAIPLEVWNALAGQ